MKKLLIFQRFCGILYVNRYAVGEYIEKNTIVSFEEVKAMATSSITKNFVVFGNKQAEVFANAVEESFNDLRPETSVKSNKVETKEELEKLIKSGKKQINDMNSFNVINIRDFLENSDSSSIGEDMLKIFLSNFSCKKNSDVERFLKEQAIDFTKQFDIREASNKEHTYIQLLRII